MDRMFWKMGMMNKRSWNKRTVVREIVDKKPLNERENKKNVLGQKVVGQLS